MATRASFWVGDPRQLNKREWLGCIAFDGYPEGVNDIRGVKTEADFRDLVSTLECRHDFAKPSGGWPYPWDGDIFLTDYTYSFFDGKLQLTCFHAGFMTLVEYDKWKDDDCDAADTLPGNVPAPSKYNRGQPDSIIIL